MDLAAVQRYIITLGYSAVYNIIPIRFLYLVYWCIVEKGWNSHETIFKRTVKIKGEKRDAVRCCFN